MLNIVIGIILLVAAVFLTVAILMQEGKSSRLSGAIAGGSDNFLGKNNKASKSKRLSAITTVVAICFTAVVLVLYILQPNENKIDTDQVNPADPDAVTTSDTATDGDKTSDTAAGGDKADDAAGSDKADDTAAGSDKADGNAEDGGTDAASPETNEN